MLESNNGQMKKVNLSDEQLREVKKSLTKLLEYCNQEKWRLETAYEKLIEIELAVRSARDLLYEDKVEEVVEAHSQDKINPDHYKTREMECIDEMFALYGAQVVLNYCICCVHKYRYRAGNKVGEDAETDLKKSDWYAKMAQNIRDDYGLLF